GVDISKYRCVECRQGREEKCRRPVRPRQNGAVTMKSFVLSAVLGLGALGLVGLTPSKAEASWLSEALHARFDPAYRGYSYYDYGPAYGYYRDYGYPYGTYYYAPAYDYVVPYRSYWYGAGYYRPWYGHGWHGHGGHEWHGGRGWHGGHEHHGGHGWHGGHGHGGHHR